jgi:hypothetical protein
MSIVNDSQPDQPQSGPFFSFQSDVAPARDALRAWILNHEGGPEAAELLDAVMEATNYTGWERTVAKGGTLSREGYNLMKASKNRLRKAAKALAKLSGLYARSTLYLVAFRAFRPRLEAARDAGDAEALIDLTVEIDQLITTFVQHGLYIKENLLGIPDAREAFRKGKEENGQ